MHFDCCISCDVFLTLYNFIFINKRHVFGCPAVDIHNVCVTLYTSEECREKFSTDNVIVPFKEYKTCGAMLHVN